MRWNARWGLTRSLAHLRGLHTESVIQDVDLPLDQAEPFLDFLLAQIGILPIWACPIRPADPALPSALYPPVPGTRSLHLSEPSPLIPVARRGLHFLARAGNEIPPQQEVLAEGLAADQEQA